MTKRAVEVDTMLKSIACRYSSQLKNNYLRLIDVCITQL